MKKRLRDSLAVLVVLIFSLVMISCKQETETPGESISAKPRQPNILLIVADDLGYSDIGPFGGEISTPTIDQLAKEGLLFSNFHALPVCSLTRSVLLSGVDNHVAGLGTMGEHKTPEMNGIPGYDGYLNHEVAALPEVMQLAGYSTYMAGKWHLGGTADTNPKSRGFDESFVLIPGGASHWNDFKPLAPPLKVRYTRNGAEVTSLPDDFYSTKYYTDQMLSWLQQSESDEKPFFAYLAYTAPHDPLHAPKEYIDKYKGRYDEGWDVLRERRLQQLKKLGIVREDVPPLPPIAFERAWKDLSTQEQANAARDMEVYAAMVHYMDEQIERVVSYLKESGQYNDTLILFFADNGANGSISTYYPGQTKEYLASFDNSLENRGHRNSYVDMGIGWAQASMAPSRMFKRFTSEGGIRVPMLVKLPGTMSNASTMNHEFFHVRDIMPTVLDIAGAQHPAELNGKKVKPMEGQSVLEMLRGASATAYDGSGRVGYELFGMKAYIDYPWKILLMPDPYGTGDWQLYNLEEDPGEQVDLGQKHPERLKKLVANWDQYQQKDGVLDVELKPIPLK